MSEAQSNATPREQNPGLILPGVWWHQPVNRPGFVQIALPQKEMDEIRADAQFAFPTLAATVIRLVDEQGDIPREAWRSNPEMARGLFNMLLLLFAIRSQTDQPDIQGHYTREAMRASLRGRLEVRPIAPDGEARKP